MWANEGKKWSPKHFIRWMNYFSRQKSENGKFAASLNPLISKNNQPNSLLLLYTTWNLNKPEKFSFLFQVTLTVIEFEMKTGILLWQHLTQFAKFWRTFTKLLPSPTVSMINPQSSPLFTCNNSLIKYAY